MDRFELQGMIYYQQYRRCGKTNCRTCREGDGHGPYWYSRDHLGHVKYIGRELPPALVRARRYLVEHDPEIVQVYSELREKLLAVERLLARAELSDDERMVLVELGFGAALV